MKIQGRCATDTLRAVDGIVDSYLRYSNLDGRRTANMIKSAELDLALDHSNQQGRHRAGQYSTELE